MATKKITAAILRKVLAEKKWVKLDAAEALGTSEASVRRLCKKYHINTLAELKKIPGLAKPSFITSGTLRKALETAKWVKLDAARGLGISEAAVRRLCDKHGINTDEEIKKATGALVPQTFSIAKPTGASKARLGTFIVMPDAHGADYDRGTVAAICAFAKDFKPEYFIQLGDLIDNTPLLGKVKMRYPSFDAVDIKALDNDYFYANEILDQIDMSVPKDCKKIFLPGNHEYRSDIILKSYPDFARLLSYKDRLNFKARGWDTSRDYLQPLELGKLKIFHGEFWGANHVKKHLTHYRRNVMYGHTHQVCQDTMASPMQEIPTWGASIGCVCNVNPEWQRGKSNCWEHGFSYGWFDKDSGDFYPMIVRIVHHKFYAEGKMYVGTNKK